MQGANSTNEDLPEHSYDEKECNETNDQDVELVSVKLAKEALHVGGHFSSH